MLLEQEYSFDAEQTREYFPMQHVTKATMEIYQELLGLKFAQIQDA
jgi:Zn-dependent oligopeptidase